MERFISRNTNEISDFKKSVSLNTNRGASYKCRAETPSSYIKLERSAFGMSMESHRARFSSLEQLLSQLLRCCILLTALASMVPAPTNNFLPLHLMASVWVIESLNSGLPFHSTIYCPWIQHLHGRGLLTSSLLSTKVFTGSPKLSSYKERDYFFLVYDAYQSNGYKKA